MLLIIGISYAKSQNRIYGLVSIEQENVDKSNIMIYDGNSKFLTKTDTNGYYEFYTEKKEINIVFLWVGTRFIEKKLSVTGDFELNITFEKETQILSEVLIKGQKIREFKLQRLNDVEGTSIYAGKKTEVILINQSIANLASNNSRKHFHHPNIF